MLTIPTSAAPGSGYPVVIFGHGLGRSRRDALLLADTLAQGGMATIAVDTVYHGDRSTCLGWGATQQPAKTDNEACADPLTMQCQTTGALSGRCVSQTTGAACNPSTDGDATCYAAGQGRCIGTGTTGTCEGGYFKTDAPSPVDHVLISGNTFLNLGNLFATRDNFRHAGALDFAQLLRVISSTTAGASLNARLTTAGLGTLDPNTVRYLGQSLGTFNGSMFAAANPTVSRFFLNVAGADQVDVLLNAPAFAVQRAGFLGALALQGIQPGTPGFDQFMTIAHTILDPADPQNVAFAAVNSSNADRQMMLQYIQNDVVLPNSGTRRWLVAGRQGVRQPSWFEFLEADAAGVGVIPSTMALAERHGFLLKPPTSSECNPLTASCATVVGRTQAVQFLAAGVTPTNTPANP